MRKALNNRVGKGNSHRRRRNLALGRSDPQKLKGMKTRRALDLAAEEEKREDRRS